MKINNVDLRKVDRAIQSSIDEIERLRPKKTGEVDLDLLSKQTRLAVTRICKVNQSLLWFAQVPDPEARKKLRKALGEDRELFLALSRAIVNEAMLGTVLWENPELLKS